MLFLLLTRVLLWIFIAVIVYMVLLRWIPKPYLTWIGGIFLFSLIVLGFLNPNDRLIASAWEILSFPLKPLGLSLLLISMAIGGIKKGVLTKNGVYQLWFAFILLTLFSLPVIAYGLAQQAELEAVLAEQRLQALCQAPCPVPLVPLVEQGVGTIVVLAQGTTTGANLPDRPYFQLNETGDRIFYASQLYWQEPDFRPLMIVSAGPRPEATGVPTEPTGQPPRSEAEDVRELLLRLGVDPNRIILETTGTDMRTSALGVRRILEERNLGTRVALVTSALDVRRATLTFANVGLQVIPRATDFITYQPGGAQQRTLRLADFIANAEALALSTRVLNEYYTFIFYFLRGWLSPTIF